MKYEIAKLTCLLFYHMPSALVLWQDTQKKLHNLVGFLQAECNVQNPHNQLVVYKA